MSEELDHNTFDLLDAITGRTYPEHSVKVSFDEKSAFDLYEVSNRIKALEARASIRSAEEDDELRELVDVKRPDLLEKMKSLTYTFLLRGVTRDARQELIDLADERYPAPQDADERAKVARERAEFVENQTWLMHIVSITNPQGQTNAALDEDTIQMFRDQAPLVAVNRVAGGIQDLTRGAKSGFETLAQDPDFLSERSPEA